MGRKIEQKDLKYEKNKYKYHFEHCEAKRYFNNSIYTSKISVDKAEMYQSNPIKNMVKSNSKSMPRSKDYKDKKRNTSDSANAIYEGRELTFNAFISWIFPIKVTRGNGRPRMLACVFRTYLA